MFAIYDSKSQIFGFPFGARTPGEAQRQFDSLVNDPQTKISQYPEDFSLWLIGDYDDVTGHVHFDAAAQRELVKALTIKKPKD